ncbi:MAG: hypothetical protein RRA94_01035 [Bacteroidota bacterium]|nr:hypothetical protein [Bacteroidota bacterium]
MRAVSVPVRANGREAAAQALRAAPVMRAVPVTLREGEVLRMKGAGVCFAACVPPVKARRARGATLHLLRVLKDAYVNYFASKYKNPKQMSRVHNRKIL